MAAILDPEEALLAWERVYSGRDTADVLQLLCVRLALGLLASEAVRLRVQERWTDRLRPAPAFLARLGRLRGQLRDGSLEQLARRDPEVAAFLVRHPQLIPALRTRDERQRARVEPAGPRVAACPPFSPLAGSLSYSMLSLGAPMRLEAVAPAPPAGEGGSSAAQNAVARTLLERARAGEADAWQRLAKLLVPLIDHWCRSAGLSEWDAQQLAPQVFQRAQAEIDTFRREGPFRGWLRTLTAAAVAAQRGRPAVALDAAAVVAPGAAESEARLVIQGALEMFGDVLDEPTREAGRRLLVQGESPQDVARALNMSAGLVHVMQARARGVLSAQVGELIE
jgi:DNA-directed RNA polymerase specialized sigma24 family protein